MRQLTHRKSFGGPTRRFALAVFATIALGVSNGQAWSDDIPVQAYAAKDPDCLAWSNGCVICARDEQGKTHCSTPGIACIPVDVTCRVSKKSP